MSRLFDSLKNAISNGLNGRMAHVSPDAVFEALDWTNVCEKPGGVPHSIWEILNHLIYCRITGYYCSKATILRLLSTPVIHGRVLKVQSMSDSGSIQ